MQRYLASDLPKQPNDPRKTAGGSGSASMPRAAEHAVGLGLYIREQRGREGVMRYVQGLRPVLPAELLEPICRQLRVEMPREADSPAAETPPVRERPRSEPDMETVLRLMQLIKGKDGPDLSALMQIMGNRS